MNKYWTYRENSLRNYGCYNFSLKLNHMGEASNRLLSLIVPPVPVDNYRNTIANLSPSEQIFIYFEKTRFASQKTEFLNCCFQQKKNPSINNLKWLRNNKILQKLNFKIFFMSS